jgi:hypothetical protein
MAPNTSARLLHVKSALNSTPEFQARHDSSDSSSVHTYVPSGTNRFNFLIVSCTCVTPYGVTMQELRGAIQSLHDDSQRKLNQDYEMQGALESLFTQVQAIREGLAALSEAFIEESGKQQQRISQVRNVPRSCRTVQAELFKPGQQPHCGVHRTVKRHHVSLLPISR